MTLGTFGPTALIAAGALLLLLAGTFAIGTKTGNHTVMDVTWGIGIAVAALASFLASVGHGDPARRWPLLVAAVAWGGRLAVHVAIRVLRSGEDPRYGDLLGRAHGNRNVYALKVVYLPQLLALCVACVTLPAGLTVRAPAGALTAVGGLVFFVGFVFETLGDWQLSRFKANPANRGQVMDRGLWRYTRHPNYFGDACMWWGLFALSYGSVIQLATLISPLVMTYTLTRGTGQRMTERRMGQDRPGYADYVARTSGFIPFPPRRPHAHPGRHRHA